MTDSLRKLAEQLWDASFHCSSRENAVNKMVPILEAADDDIFDAIFARLEKSTHELLDKYGLPKNGKGFPNIYDGLHVRLERHFASHLQPQAPSDELKELRERVESAEINRQSAQNEIPPDVWEESCGTVHVAIRLLVAQLRETDSGAQFEPQAGSERWISVDERLPEINDAVEYVLVKWRDEYRGKNLSRYEDEPDIASPCGMDTCFISYLRANPHFVTHWRELPAEPIEAESAPKPEGKK